MIIHIKRSYFYLFFLILLLNCSKNINEPDNSETTGSIIGRIVDKASNKGISGATVKIKKTNNAFQTATNNNGEFEFKEIPTGEYNLFIEVDYQNKTVIDSIGIFNTKNPDWGTIYSETFCSIIGNILLEGTNDHSFISVQLLGSDKIAETTNKGHFRIDFIFPDIYDLYITKDENYNEIRINDMELHAGQIIEIDTTLTYKFKPLVLQPCNDLNFLSNAYGGFCYYKDYFYLPGYNGLYRYDSNSEEQIKVYDHYYLGNPHIAYDYSDNIWIAMDEPSKAYYRKFSISESKIIDSLSLSDTFFSYNFELSWDPTSNSLVGISFSRSIYVYSFNDNTITTHTPVIEEFDPSDYKQLTFNNIFIDPNGQIYVTVVLKDNFDKWHTYLYLWDNLNSFNLLKIYKFPTSFHYFSSLSYYEGKIYTVGWNDKTVYEIIF